MGEADEGVTRCWGEGLRRLCSHSLVVPRGLGALPTTTPKYCRALLTPVCRVELSGQRWLHEFSTEVEDQLTFNELIHFTLDAST